MSSLARLYLLRGGFAVVWAIAFAVLASPYDRVALALAVLYPVVDLVCSLVDARSASRPALPYVNAALSLAAAVALTLVGTGDLGPVLLVWGAWAVTAGAVQLLVALGRRAGGGQWPMVLSGGISVLAGVAFAATSASATSATGLAGYALLGGVFFLVSGLRLGRTPGRVATT
jgi:uncharacterized membrane protein HdeD (DUF308 family)